MISGWNDTPNGFPQVAPRPPTQQDTIGAAQHFSQVLHRAADGRCGWMEGSVGLIIVGFNSGLMINSGLIVD